MGPRVTGCLSWTWAHPSSSNPLTIYHDCHWTCSIKTPSGSSSSPSPTWCTRASPPLNSDEARGAGGGGGGGGKVARCALPPCRCKLPRSFACKWSHVGREGVSLAGTRRCKKEYPVSRRVPFAGKWARGLWCGVVCPLAYPSLVPSVGCVMDKEPPKSWGEGGIRGGRGNVTGMRW